MNQLVGSRQEARHQEALFRPPTQREVLRVLWAGDGEYLVRSQIHKRMPRARRPTLGRVGQILTELYGEGLLVRRMQSAQGARKAGFYALSESGQSICRRLGFVREEHLLFQVTKEQLRFYLTQERLARCPESPGRIIAAYGYSGGLGRSTLVAHVAKGLAESLALGEEILAIDLDFGSSGLDASFAPEGLESCRGLGGLLLEFERREPRKRELWLRGAMTSREFVLRLPDLPGLGYMPSGLSPGQDVLSPSERVEAMALLHAEAGLVWPGARSGPKPEALGFFNQLRTVMLDKFSRTLLDPQCGRSLGGWIATQFLAEELILCARVADTATATVAGLRAVVASFLHKHAATSAGGGVTFLFRLTEPWTGKDLHRWIDRHLVQDAEPSELTPYQAEQLFYDARLAEPSRRWANTQFYKNLIARFNPGAAQLSPPPQLQALMALLDPEKDPLDRSIAAGILENAPCQELARWVERYERTETLPVETDTRGKQLIQSVLKVQMERLLTKIVGAQEARRLAQDQED